MEFTGQGGDHYGWPFIAYGDLPVTTPRFHMEEHAFDYKCALADLAIAVFALANQPSHDGHSDAGRWSGASLIRAAIPTFRSGHASGLVRSVGVGIHRAFWIDDFMATGRGA